MSNYPTISVCIPTYNRARLLGEALRSVLSQVDLPDEVVVCDNASADDTESVVRSLGSPLIRYHRNTENVGMCGNFNVCLKQARGDIVGLLHSDDWYEPEALRHVREAFVGFPEAAVVYSPAARPGQPDAGGKPAAFLRFSRGLEAAKHVYEMWQLPCSATFYRREAALQAGGFSSAFAACCDEEFNSRLSLWGDVVRCSRPFAGYRRHAGHTMFEIWEDTGFVRQYLESRLQMARNSGLNEKRALHDVVPAVAWSLVGAAAAVARQGRLEVARRLHHEVWRLHPRTYSRPKAAAFLVLHALPSLATRLAERARGRWRQDVDR